MTAGSDKPLTQIGAARLELERRIQSELELLDAMKKVEVFFASQNRTMTRAEAHKLLLAAPGKVEKVEKVEEPPPRGYGSWPQRILAALADGPRTSREIMSQMRADGFMRDSKADTSYHSAITRMRKVKQIVKTSDGNYMLPAGKVKKGRPSKAPTTTQWSNVVPQLLADGTPRTASQIFTALEAQYGTLNRKHFGTMMPYMRHQGFIVRDAQGRHTLGKRQ